MASEVQQGLDLQPIRTAGRETSAKPQPLRAFELLAPRLDLIQQAVLEVHSEPDSFALCLRNHRLRRVRRTQPRFLSDGVHAGVDRRFHHACNVRTWRYAEPDYLGAAGA